MRHNKLKSKGFTAVEILVIAPIVVLVLAAFVLAIVTMVGNVLASRKQNAITYDIQDALNRIEQDVKVSGGYLATNNIALTTPQGVDDVTEVFDNVSAKYGQILILNSYATTGNPISDASSRNLVYLNNSPNACSSLSVNLNNKMMVNVVYYSRDNSLWRRVIMKSDYANPTVYCSTPWQKPSCTPNYTEPFCKVNDQQLVEGVGISDFTTSYYTNAASSSPNTTTVDVNSDDATRQTALRTTNTVLVTITSRLTVSGKDIVQSGSIKAVSPNNNS